MAKGEKLKTDDFDLDKDLDFNFDIGDIEGQISPEAKTPKKRNPVSAVFTGTVGGIKTTLKDPSFLANVTKKSLPDSYGEVFNAADQVGSTATALYDEAVKELKPQLAAISKKVDRLVPDESKFLKKATGKIAKFFGVEDSTVNQGPTKEQIQDQSIAIALGQVFSQKQELDQDAEARQNAEEKIKDHIEGKRFESNFGILNSINESATRLANYTERVTQAYQKKSLELQFRSYFVQSELLSATNRYFEVFKAQNEAIAKNTSLPEFVKINNSERFKDLARNKFFSGVQDSLFGKGSFIGRSMEKIKKDGKAYIGGIKQGLEGVYSGVDAFEQMQEMNKTMEELGGQKTSGAELAGTFLGGAIGNKLGDVGAKYLKPRLEKNKLIRDIGNKGSTFAMNAGGVLDDWQNSEKFRENMDASGPKGWAYGMADKAINYLKTGGPDMSIGNPAGTANLDKVGAGFDMRTQRSVVDIIPGYLAKILREITVFRTGDENAPTVLYDHTSGRFVDKKEVGKSIVRSLSTRTRTSGYGYFLDKASEDIIGDKEVDDKDKNEVRDFFSKIATIPDMNYTPENIMNTRIFASLGKKSQQLVREHLEEIQNGDRDAGINKLTKRFMDIQKVTPDIRGEIEEFIRLGYGDILVEQGLVERDESGNYKINQEKYFEFLRDSTNTVKSDRNAKRDIREVKGESVLKNLKGGMKGSLGSQEANDAKMGKRGKKNRRLVKSDVTAKEGITSMEPRSALDAIKNTKVYKWFYKKGEGDDMQRTGPMAQDVRRTMGEDAAPGGTKIDLTTMNGNTMAAVQALSEKQDQMLQGDQSAIILKDIKSDTEAMVKLLQGSGGRGGYGAAGTMGAAGNDYGSEIKNAAGSLGHIGVKAAGDLAKSAKNTAMFTKDKIILPTAKFMSDTYDKYKDPAKELALQMLGKANDARKRLTAVGKDLLTDKLPKGIAMARNFGNKVVDTFKNLTSKAKDIYIAGSKSPALQATLMRAGYYRDQATGKVIENINQLRNAVGNIIDANGEVVLSIKDRAAGLYDSTGQKMKFGLAKLGQLAAGYAAEGFKRGKDFLKKALPITGQLIKSGANMLEGASKRIGSWMSGIPIGGTFGFGNDKIYDVLVEIRDLMRGEDPPRHETKRDFKKFFVGPMPQKELTKHANQAIAAAKKARSKVSEKTGEVVGKLKGKIFGQKPDDNFMGPMPESFVDQAKNRAAEARDLAGAKLLGRRKSDEFVGPMPQGIVQKGQDKMSSILTSIRDLLKKKDEEPAETTQTIVEEQPQKQAAEPLQADTDPKYRSGTNAIDSIFSMGKKLKGMMPAAKDKLAGAASAMAGAKGIKGKALAGIGSLFKTSAQAEPEKTEGAAEQTATPKETKPKSKKQPAKTDSEDEPAGENAKTVKTITGRKGKKAFNDQDGNGRRDGDWRDRLEKQEQRKKAATKDPLQADLAARYKSDQNVIDTIMQKASGMFDFVKGGMGNILSSAGDLLSGGKGMLGKLGKGVGTFAKSPISSTAKGIWNAGKAAVGTLGKIGAPVARGLGAVGRIGAVGRVLSAGRMVQTALTVGSLMTGGVGSIAMAAASTAMTALGGILASPVVLGALAVGAVAYGGYKLYKYMTRNDVTKFSNIRLKQYGLGFDPNSNKFNSYMLALEEYLQDGRVGYDRGKAYLLDKKIEKEELLSIFKIDKDDEEMVQRFGQWFQERFKPFFLTHLTALYSVDNKIKLSQVEKLKPKQQIQYLENAKFEAGPYNATTSPIKDIAQMNTDKESVNKMIDSLLAELRKADQVSDKKEKAPVAPPPPAKAEGAADSSKKDANSTVAKDKKDTPEKLKTPVKSGTTSDKDKTPVEPTGEEGESKPKAVGSVVAQGKAGTSKVVMADGPMRDGEGAAPYLDMGKNVKLDGMNPSLLRNLKGMIQEYGERTGKKVLLTDGTRSTAEQEALYRKNPKKAAKPGRSLHEFGLAVDMNSPDAEAMDDLGLMRKYGFTRPVGGETWHVEPAGIGVNLDRARKDPDFATQAIQASLFKGGGGIGSMEGLGKEFLGKRDPAMALQLMNIDAPIAKDSSDKDKVTDVALAPKKDASKMEETPKPAAKTETKVASSSSSTSTSTSTTTTSGGGSTTTTAEGKVEKKPEPTKVATMTQQVSQSEKYSKVDTLPDVEQKPAVKLASTAAEQPKNPNDKGEVKKVVEKIAEKQNVEPEMMSAFAAVESSLNPNAKAPNTSATGLYQFTKATWNEQMMKNARKYDLDPSTSPTDVRASTLMASEYIKSNKRALQSVKSDPSLTDIYLAHFLGAGGAKKFLAADPNAIAAQVVPNAAGSNPNIFYENGRPLTISEVYTKIDRKLAGVAKSYGINVELSKPLESKNAKAGGNTQSEAPTSGAFPAPAVKTMPGTKPGPTTIAADGTVTRQAQPVESGQQAQPTQAPRGGFFKPQQPTVLASNDSANMSRSMSSGSNDLSSVSSTLDQQLTVQKQMLDVLKAIAEKVDPEQMKEIMEGLNKTQGQQGASGNPTPSATTPRGMTQVKSSVDLSRKVA